MSNILKKLLKTIKASFWLVLFYVKEYQFAILIASKNMFNYNSFWEAIEYLRRGEVSSVISRGGHSSSNIIIYYEKFYTMATETNFKLVLDFLNQDLKISTTAILRFSQKDLIHVSQHSYLFLKLRVGGK